MTNVEIDWVTRDGLLKALGMPAGIFGASALSIYVLSLV